MDMEEKQELDLCSVIWIKASEFTERYGMEATDLILPLFVKEHLLRNYKEFGDTYITHLGEFRFMGFIVHWTMVDDIKAIQVFQKAR